MHAVCPEHTLFFFFYYYYYSWVMGTEHQKLCTCRYICHASWAILAPVQFLYLKSRKSAVPWRSFLRSHIQFIRSTAQMVQFNTNRISTAQSLIDPVPHFMKKIAIITCTLTVAGSSWFIALNLTTPSDLTAIYNCSAFFAYAFSIPLLGEKVRLGKVVSVAIAISGVMVVAYGDGGDTGTESGGGGGVPTGRGRVLGNLLIGVGSVLYGLYEVIYKKMACPPESTSPGRSVIFANVVASSIGAFTLVVLWVPLVVLHLTGIEPFELPTGKAGWLMAVSALAGVGFSGGFLVLISLTSPVLSSVAGLFTIFLVALADWLLTAVPLTLAAVMGGVLIIGAFALLSWESWKELKEGEEKRLKRDDADVDVDVDDDVESPEEEGASQVSGLGLSSAEERGRLIREAD